MPKVRKLSSGEFMEGMAKAGVKMKGKGIGKKILKGLKAAGKEAIAIAAPVIKEVARDMLKQKVQQYASSGAGLYAARTGRGMKMSAAQIRTLKKGGAIQIKPSMMDEAGRYMMSLKPEVERMLDKALSRMKGMRIMPQDIEGLMDMKRGGNINFEGLLRDTGKYLQPTADAAQDRAMKELRGSGKRGRGPFDFLRPLEKAISPVTNAIADSGVPSFLIREGLPVVTGALGGIVGGPAGSMVGKEAGRRLGKRQADKYGYGLYAGAGVIQLGSPYLDPKSAAADPFIPKKNPFT
jgi:hypothetical protein